MYYINISPKRPSLHGMILSYLEIRRGKILDPVEASGNLMCYFPHRMHGSHFHKTIHDMICVYILISMVYSIRKNVW